MEEIRMSLRVVSDLLELYFVMDGTCYFVERPMTNKSKDFVLNFFHNLPVRLFRQMTRMDKRSFFELVGMIEDHPVFHNSFTAAQALVAWQLAVCLDRLGHDGNGACLNHLIPTWGVLNGSLYNFTSRCFIALGTALQGLLKWPDRVEQAQISNEFAKKGLPGYVGLIDGTIIPLSQRPAKSGECYYDRKCRYSMNAQVICDNRRKILLLYTGPCGSVSDLTCFRCTSLCCDMDKGHLFGPDEYILGDSGYMAMSHVVSAYKRSDLSVDKENFNSCVAKARVTNEHCIGVLKSRWHSLKEIRIQLNTPKDNLWLVRWKELVPSCTIMSSVGMMSGARKMTLSHSIVTVTKIMTFLRGRL